MSISKKDVERFKELDLKAYKMFKEGMSIANIAKELGVKRQSLSKRLKEKYNIEVLPDGKKSVDDNFFKTIDSAEKAYWLGFMYADGYVGKDNKVELALKESDINHVEKFKISLKSNHKISKKKTILNGKDFYSYRISIQSKKLSHDLSSHGCINKKSLICTFPNILDDLLPDYIRGFFDGDGCIYFDKRIKRTIPKIDIACGSYDFIFELQKILNKKFNIPSYIYADRTIYSLRVYKEEYSFKFLNLLYANSNENIRLNRKYNLYTFCRLEPKLLETQED